jgi:osmotically-inducible protein OsmY
MNLKSITARTAIAAVALATAPAFADWMHPFHRDSYQGTYRSDRLLAPTSAIHSGAANSSDQALADAVADALKADPGMYGATATVSAKDGRVALSGSAKNLQQAARAEQVARRVAGVGSVSGTLDAQGG